MGKPKRSRALRASRPYCFVLMPFGMKTDAAGGTVDFDAVYGKLIRPAIEAAEMQPIRADEEMTGGIIHKPMYERLIFCEYAVADLTTANANVFYELGVRHAVRPYSTVTMASEQTRLPFDVGYLRAFLYPLNRSGMPADIDRQRSKLTDRLHAAREASTDSPLFQLVEGWHVPPLDHSKTDVFRERVNYSEDAKRALAAARKRGRQAVRSVEAGFGDLKNLEAGVVIDLFLSYRAVEAWPDMIHLAERMSPLLARTTMVQEQLGFALNRAGRGDEAEKVLLELIETRGPSSETLGLLGRVYKDRWQGAAAAADTLLAAALLDKAIHAYVRGFEADWRDPFPGINALTLMEVRDPADPRRDVLLPVVRYSAMRRIASGQANYWDHATMLELAVLASDEQGARDALGQAISQRPEKREQKTWEPETTARNLGLIRAARERRGANQPWLRRIEERLRRPSSPGPLKAARTSRPSSSKKSAKQKTAR